MAARGTVNQVVQVGKQSAAGSAVAGNKLLPGISFRFSPERVKENFRATGFKNTTQTVDNGGWATGSYEGPVDYNQLVWPLEGLIGSTGATGSGVAKTWPFLPLAAGADANSKLYTVELGDSAAAQQYVDVQFRSFQLAVSKRQGSRMSGNVFSQFPNEGVTLTSGPTAVAQRPVGAKQWDVYLDPTFGAIGTTKIASAYAFGFAVGDKFNPFWALNSSYPNIKDSVEIAHDINGSISTEHNSQSRSLFSGIPANAVQYLRFEALGLTLQTGVTEHITIDLAVQFGNPAAEDVDGVFGMTYNFDSVYDANLGGNWRATVVNAISAV
ncbi:MAG: hypothetical protein M3268_00705 [Acidobacteriota bacterium]|nr:hypothetical protein [Acidobacteriota bacterium]